MLWFFQQSLLNRCIQWSNMLLKLFDEWKKVGDFFLRIRLLVLNLQLWFLDKLLLFFRSLCILLFLEKLRIKPSPFQTLERIVIFSSKIQKLSFWSCCQLQRWLVILVDKIFMIFFVLEITEILYLFIKLLVLDKIRYFQENFLEVFLKQKSVDLTHCFFNFFSVDVKLLDINVYIVSWVLDC